MTKDEFMAALKLLPTIGFRPVLMGHNGRDIRFLDGPSRVMIDNSIGCCPLVAVAILQGGPNVPNYSYPKAGKFLGLDDDVAGDLARAADSNFTFDKDTTLVLRKEMLEAVGFVSWARAQDLNSFATS